MRLPVPSLGHLHVLDLCLVGLGVGAILVGLYATEELRSPERLGWVFDLAGAAGIRIYCTGAGLAAILLGTKGRQTLSAP